jgi:hypothetical protein
MKTLMVAASLALSSVAGAAGAGQEDVVKMQERQGEAIKKNAPDCDKIGDALLANADADAATMKQLVAAEAGKTKEQKKTEQQEMVAKYGDRLKVAQKNFEPLRACKGNAKIKQWKDKLDAAVAPPKH